MYFEKKAFQFIFAMSLGIIQGCGGKNGDSNVEFNSKNEMTGLMSSESDPPTEGEAWTYGDLEQARGFYACSEEQRQAGIYSCGSLANPDRIPPVGSGYRLIYPASRVAFATYDLITIMQTAAAAIATKYPDGEELNVGEMSRAGGGYTNGHDSHQNGLDVDIGYYRVGQGLLPTVEYLESMVRGERLSEHFDFSRNYDFMKMLVRTGRVNRIFVHPVIKRGLCEYARRLGENTEINPYLSLIRGYPEHADHMHVRITCPKNSPKCRSQILPAGETECSAPVPTRKQPSGRV